MKKFVKRSKHNREVAELTKYWEDRVSTLNRAHEAEVKSLHEQYKRKLNTSRELQAYMHEVEKRVNATPSGKWVRTLGPYELGETVVLHNEAQSTETD